jgi:hypothetical protein
MGIIVYKGNYILLLDPTPNLHNNRSSMISQAKTKMTPITNSSMASSPTASPPTTGSS